MQLRSFFDSFDRRDWQAAQDGTVRFAMIGLGWWTREHAIPAARAEDRTDVTAVVSSRPEKAERVAESHGIEHALTYEQFHDGTATDAYDAVYVCTPNATHLEYVESAAEFGKAVLCEKPMEASIDRAERMVDACADADVTLMVAYRLHTDPATRRLKELLADGFVGEPVHVHGSMSQPLLEMIPNLDQWRLRRDLSGYGTSVMDLGIYPINTTRFLLERDPVAASASMYSGAEGFEDVPDERAACTVEYEGNCLGSFTASQNAAQDDHLRVVGTEGWVALESAFHIDGRVRLARNEIRHEVEIEQVDQMREEFAYFADCVLAGREPYADGEHGLLDMKALSAIYRAAETGEREPIE